MVRSALQGGGGDDGLIQRFQLAVYPDKMPWKMVDRWPSKKAKEQAYNFFELISKLEIPDNQDDRPGLRFSDDAQSLFYDWLTQLEAEIREDDIHPALESHFAKYRSLVPSLALICHTGDNPEKNFNIPVGKGSLLQALAWYEYLKSHAKRIFSMAINSHNENAINLLQKIKSGIFQNSSFKENAIHRKGWAGLTETSDVEKAVSVLDDHGYLKRETISTGGRPSTIVHVSPYVEIKGD